MRTPDPRDPETYALALLAEECGEVVQMIGKAGRFGLDTPSGRLSTGGLNSATTRMRLEQEAGDVIAAMEYACQRGLMDRKAVKAAARDKLQRLLNPNAVDNLGRRLAP